MPFSKILQSLRATSTVNKGLVLFPIPGALHWNAEVRRFTCNTIQCMCFRKKMEVT